MTVIKRFVLFSIVLFLSNHCTSANTQAQDFLLLEAVRDNTLIESSTGSFSNGAGPYLFVGRVDTTGDLKLRRALIYFDISSLPLLPEQLTGGTLQLYVSRPETGAVETFSLYRVVKDWGEGASSNAGGIGDVSTTEDATWIHSFYEDQFWDMPGGDFESMQSAEFEMGGKGIYGVTSEGILEDIVFWLRNPELNFGWISNR